MKEKRKLLQLGPLRQVLEDDTEMTFIHMYGHTPAFLAAKDVPQMLFYFAILPDVSEPTAPIPRPAAAL
jgi:hypothetical protein